MSLKVGQGHIKFRWILGVALLVIVVGLAYASLQSGRREKTGSHAFPTVTVQKGPLEISITETGTIHPREQIILKNEMDQSATILSIVPEGSHVTKGDLLVELDATTWEDALVERRIRLQNSKAEWISAEENLAVVQNQAQADIEAAELKLRFAHEDLKKYHEGEFPKQLNELEAKITIAQEELSKAEQDYTWSKKLFEEKYLSKSQLQQDEIAFKKAELNVKLARENFDLFKVYTHKRQLDQLESDVSQAELALERVQRKGRANEAEADARLQAAHAEYEEDRARVKRLEKEIAKSKIHAPINGVVLYATSVEDDWRRDEEPIEVGTTIRERDEIIYLPTASAYNVDIKVPEVNLNKIHKDLPVEIRVDALQGRTFQGKVSAISPVPDSDRRSLNPNLKVYNVEIEVSGGNEHLRNGMSCKAEILIRDFEEAIYVPVQSVVRRGNQPMVYLVDHESYRPHGVELGLDDNINVVIEEGLSGGELVMLAPPLQGDLPEDEEPSEEFEVADED